MVRGPSVVRINGGAQTDRPLEWAEGDLEQGIRPIRSLARLVSTLAANGERVAGHDQLDVLLGDAGQLHDRHDGVRGFIDVHGRLPRPTRKHDWVRLPRGDVMKVSLHLSLNLVEAGGPGAVQAHV